jgi:tRNA 2-thiouridine synthesizing protein A
LDATLLDTKGMKCPLPVLRARRAMKQVEAGSLLEVHATDPDSVKDFHAFCETTGDELLEWHEEEGVYIFRIRKAG